MAKIQAFSAIINLGVWILSLLRLPISPRPHLPSAMARHEP